MIEKKDLINRLHSSVGHMQAVERMIEDDSDCEAVLHQLHAISASMQKIRELVLEHYMQECMDKSKAIDPKELMELFKKTWK